VNHGSLSDRIMSRYGDTPAGMVESCMEFLRICREENFDNIVISIKASNTVVMVQTVRLLVATMLDEGMSYPLHLGVTEAGDAEDGRIKSAVGIGALLADGIGDTIRVSLSEEPEKEIPVALKLMKHVVNCACHLPIKAKPSDLFNPYVYQRREALAVGNIGNTYVPVVVGTGTDFGDLQPDYLKNHLGSFYCQANRSRSCFACSRTFCAAHLSRSDRRDDRTIESCRKYCGCPHVRSCQSGGRNAGCLSYVDSQRLSGAGYSLP
jgi:Enzyme involved in the deoxyxylulose pathway of isoprenoid biosynthesis